MPCSNNFNKAPGYGIKHKFYAAYYYLTKRASFGQLRHFCLFIGYPRSGHTLIAAILDAHPNVIIGQEFNIMQYMLYKPAAKESIIANLLAQSALFRKSQAMWNDYHYDIKNQWQGRFQQLWIVGDKKAGVTSSLLGRDITLLQHLEQAIQKPIKFIHVLRNPFDIISSIAVHRYKTSSIPLAELNTIIDIHFTRVKTIDALKREGKHTIHDIMHEDFINAPKTHIHSLCGFLGVPVNEQYLHDCSKIVNHSLYKTRESIHWPDELIQRVQHKIEQFDFLTGYGFE